MMLSVHGLVRSQEPELGRDPDTGGQVGYVVELARALGRHSAVKSVELVTRLIKDPEVAPDYGEPEEEIGPNAKLVRLPFGPDRYLRKELLWGSLDQLVDRCLERVRRGERPPDLVHGHYADAGYVGTRISQALGIPLAQTGHSLGRAKRARLLASGRNAASLEKQFSLSRRIAAEEEALDHASLVVASTRQEARQQYAAYELFHPKRCIVIPPGIDTTRFSPPVSRADPPMDLVDRFLVEPGKPMILSICRPAEKKNLLRLVEAYGQDPELQIMANLVVVAGNREDVRLLEEPTRSLFVELLATVDRYDLYGKIALPRTHRSEDIPDLYRCAVRRRGVFVNPALTEPFGLTLIEAAASGLPVVATNDGGPSEILESCENGVLVDPLDRAAITRALKEVLSDQARWKRWSRNGIAGVRRHYSWDGHADRYVTLVSRLARRERKRTRRRAADRFRAVPENEMKPELALVADIDNTLVGDASGLESLLAWLRRTRPKVLFGIASGRHLESTISILQTAGVPPPDVLVTGVGTEIHYGSVLARDEAWTRHIAHGWRRDEVARAFEGLPGIELQAPGCQSPFKLSYDVDAKRMPLLDELKWLLSVARLPAKLVFSHGLHLDVLPVRASKGMAIRYLASRLSLPLECFLVAGDSGNDLDMLTGDAMAIVVGNYSSELEVLRGEERVYFASASYARGILEGIEHYEVGWSRSLERAS
ncbi:MAG: HAD-IIB family hydrolase [Thermoanaerobaculia bacterium]